MKGNAKPEGGAQAPLDRSLVLGAVNDASDDLARLADGIAALETLAHAAGGEGLAVVVGALEGAAAVALLADLAGDVAAAAGDVVEAGEVPVAHLDGAVAVIDDQEARHRSDYG